jgi:hypothetical protein
MKTWHRRWVPAFPLSVAALVIGCGSSSPSVPSPASGSPTFSNIYANIIETNGCTSCHNSSTLAGNLDMSTQDTAYMSLVGVPALGPSCGRMGRMRVVAGDPSMSLFYEKVMPEPPCGAQMPKGGLAVATGDPTLIWGWISGGAPNN